MAYAEKLMKIGYARVSTREQSFDLQLDALRRAGCEKIYQEIVSGAQAIRPQLDLMLDHLRAGDVLIIWKLDRLGALAAASGRTRSWPPAKRGGPQEPQ